jgi:hypothetical protein
MAKIHFFQLFSTYGIRAISVFLDRYSVPVILRKLAYFQWLDAGSSMPIKMALYLQIMMFSLQHRASKHGMWKNSE